MIDGGLSMFGTGHMEMDSQNPSQSLSTRPSSLSQSQSHNTDKDVSTGTAPVVSSATNNANDVIDSEVQKIDQELKNKQNELEEKFQQQNLLPWFPGKVREIPPSSQSTLTDGSTDNSSSNILTVNGAFSTILEQMEPSKLLLVYKLFFYYIFKLFKGSTYRKKLIKDGWKGKFSYSDFSAPWLKQYISVFSVSIHVNPKQLIGVPNAKDLRN